MPPRLYFFSLLESAGLIKRHSSQQMYGKAAIKPPIMAILMAEVKVPLTAVTWKSILIAGMQSASPKCSQFPNLHKAPYVKKVCLAGASIILSYTQSMFIKMSITAASQATTLLTRCQRNASTWPKKSVGSFGNSLLTIRRKNCFLAVLTVNKYV